MTDIVKRLREPPFGTETSERNLMSSAADEIERLRAENARLLANAKQDTGYLAAYHHWCTINGCAPSSSDLIAARAALAEKGEKS